MILPPTPSALQFVLCVCYDDFNCSILAFLKSPPPFANQERQPSPADFHPYVHTLTPSRVPPIFPQSYTPHAVGSFYKLCSLYRFCSFHLPNLPNLHNLANLPESPEYPESSQSPQSPQSRESVQTPQSPKSHESVQTPAARCCSTWRAEIHITSNK